MIFPASVLVSVYRNRIMVCGFDEYRAFLNYMTGRDLMIHDLVPARRLAARALENQHEEFANIPPLPEKTDSGVNNRYIKQCVKVLGAQHLEVMPLVNPFRTRTLSRALEDLYG